MDVINYTKFRKHLKKNLDHVSDNDEVVVVSRSQYKNVVILSLKEYNSLNETIYLLSSDENRQRLSKAIKEMESGKSFKHNLIED